MKYHIRCKKCGRLLFKTKDSVVALLAMETKCPNPNCKRTIIVPDDVIVTSEEGDAKGLEKT